MLSNMWLKDPQNFYYVATLSLILSGFATAFYSKEDTRTTVKNLLGGLCAGLVTGIISDAFQSSPAWILLTSNIVTIAGVRLWPLVTFWAEKYINRLGKKYVDKDSTKQE